MRGGTIVREARRRAGLTQAELARRVGTTQSAIARLERARTEPDLARVAQLVRACDLELVPALHPADTSNWSLAQGNLRLTIDDRVRQHDAWLRLVRAAREAADERRGRA